MITVALIGPDGAGKSTVSRQLEQADLPAPVKSLYMGVNLHASGLMLPTTRLALALKRRRGGRSDLVAATDRQRERGPQPDPAKRLLRGGKDVARLALWVTEEWFRVLVATGYRASGRIVIFDRHFFADYYHYDVGPSRERRPLPARVHGLLLRRLYPKPDLVVCLDAPGEVLFSRKQEATPEWLESRRQQYLELAAVVPHFVVVDATRSTEQVTGDVAAAIRSFCSRGAA